MLRYIFTISFLLITTSTYAESKDDCKCKNITLRCLTPSDLSAACDSTDACMNRATCELNMPVKSCKRLGYVEKDDASVEIKMKLEDFSIKDLPDQMACHDLANPLAPFIIEIYDKVSDCCVLVHEITHALESACLEDPNIGPEIACDESRAGENERQCLNRAFERMCSAEAIGGDPTKEALCWIRCQEALPAYVAAVRDDCYCEAGKDGKITDQDCAKCEAACREFSPDDVSLECQKFTPLSNQMELPPLIKKWLEDQELESPEDLIDMYCDYFAKSQGHDCNTYQLEIKEDLGKTSF